MADGGAAATISGGGGGGGMAGSAATAGVAAVVLADENERRGGCGAGARRGRPRRECRNRAIVGRRGSFSVAVRFAPQRFGFWAAARGFWAALGA